MKKVFTSNYARSGKHLNAYAISVYPPNWYEGKSLSFLAPDLQTVLAYKHHNLSQKEYIIQYLKHITRHGQTAQDLYDKIPDGAILLCYESPSDFCHRFIFSKWIFNTLNIEIPEILNEREQNKLIQNNFVDSILDF